MPNTDLVTPSAAPNLAAPNLWMTWMDSSMNNIMVPTYLHVPICFFLLCCFPTCRHSFLVGIQFLHFSCPHIFPFPPFSVFNVAHVFCFGRYSIFPFFQVPHFLRFPLLVFNVAHIFFFSGFCNYYVSGFPRWFPNDQWFFNCVKASRFPLGFCFFNRGGGGRFALGAFPPPPTFPRTQEVPPSIGADLPRTPIGHT